MIRGRDHDRVYILRVEQVPHVVGRGWYASPGALEDLPGALEGRLVGVTEMRNIDFGQVVEGSSQASTAPSDADQAYIDLLVGSDCDGPAGSHAGHGRGPEKVASIHGNPPMPPRIRGTRW